MATDGPLNGPCIQFEERSRPRFVRALPSAMRTDGPAVKAKAPVAAAGRDGEAT